MGNKVTWGWEEVWRHRGTTLITHCHPAPSLRMSGVISPLPLLCHRGVSVQIYLYLMQFYLVTSHLLSFAASLPSVLHSQTPSLRDDFLMITFSLLWQFCLDCCYPVCDAVWVVIGWRFWSPQLLSSEKWKWIYIYIYIYFKAFRPFWRKCHLQPQGWLPAESGCCSKLR